VILPKTHEQRIGRWGETVAGYFLEQRGYRVLARNVRTGRGEIDLVARQEATSTAGGALAPLNAAEVLVFIEVKTRTNERFGLPEEAVDARKLEHLFRAAEAYLLEHPELAGQDWRIEAIAIQGKPGDKVEDVHIEHFENISA
jgi:putative endonuclease